jgi:glucose-6-phosphate 1-epimerase
MKVLVQLSVVGIASALIAQPLQQHRKTVASGTRVGRGNEEAGLGYVELTHDSGASAKVFPFGADVCSFKDSDGTEWIAVRPDAKLDGSKPISGGLSHCFPQFGPGEIQQ